MQDLKANESRLRDINKVASELESEGLMAEEAPVLQAQVPSSCCTRQLSTTPPSIRLTSLSLTFLMLQQQEVLGAAPGKVHSLFILATFCLTFEKKLICESIKVVDLYLLHRMKLIPRLRLHGR